MLLRLSSRAPVLDFDSGDESDGIEERTLVVRNLPWSVTEEELMDAFGGDEHVESAKHFMGRDGRPSGKGRITMHNRQQANSIVENGAESVELDGRKVGVRLQSQRWHRKATNTGRTPTQPHDGDGSDEDRTLVLSNLAWVTTAQDLKVALGGCGGAEVEAARLEYLADGRPAGSGYVRFTTPEGARAAIQYARSQGQRKLVIDNRPVNMRLQSAPVRFHRAQDVTALTAQQRHEVALRVLAARDASMDADFLNRRVVVTGLPYSADQDRVEALFAGYGVEDCELLRVTLGGLEVPAGAAVVQLANEEDAEEALLHLNGQAVQGRPVDLQLESELAVDEEAPTRANRDLRRVRVSNLHPSTTWKDLKDLCRQLGPVGYTQVRSMGSARVGTVEFRSMMHARNAPAHLSGLSLRGSPIKVELYPAGAAAAAAEARGGGKEPAPAGGHAARRCRVFLSNLPWSMTSDDLQASTASVLTPEVSSALEACDVLRRKSDGRSLGSAILTFADADAASAAIEAIHGKELADGRVVYAREDRETN